MIKDPINRTAKAVAAAAYLMFMSDYKLLRV